MNNFDTEIMIPHLRKIWIKDPITIVHCGAHLAEELDEYEAEGWTQITWIEANPQLIPALKANTENHPGSEVICAAVWSETGIPLTLQIANNSYSSSILNFGTHADTYPDIVYNGEIQVSTQTLDSITEALPAKSGALLVLDLQGAELEALKGASQLLEKCNYIYTELSKTELYEKQGNWDSITTLVSKAGFRLVDWQYSENLQWGDALYARNCSYLKAFVSRIKRRKLHRATAVKFMEVQAPF